MYLIRLKTSKSIMKSNTIIYYIGHYGFLIKSLIHSETYHAGERKIFIFDCTNCSEETLDFIHLKHNLLNTNATFIMHNESVFWKPSTVQESETQIVNYYSDLLNKFGISIESVSNWYIGFDDRNSLGAFLSILNINHSIFDVNSQTYWEMYDKIDNAHPNWYGYKDVLRKYRCLNNDSKNVTEIIWDTDNHKDVAGKTNTIINFPDAYKRTTSEFKNQMNRLFDTPEISEDSVLLLLSSKHFVYSGPAILGDMEFEYRFYYPFLTILDLFYDLDTRIVVKNHPFYSRPTSEIKNVLMCNDVIAGYTPADILVKTNNFNINTVLALETSSARFCCVDSKHVSMPYIYKESTGCVPLYCILEMIQTIGGAKNIIHNLNTSYFDYIFKFAVNKQYENNSNPEKNQIAIIINEDNTIRPELQEKIIKRQYDTLFVFSTLRNAPTLPGKDATLVIKSYPGSTSIFYGKEIMNDCLVDICCSDPDIYETIRGYRFSKKLIRSKYEIVCHTTSGFNRTSKTQKGEEYLEIGRSYRNGSPLTHNVDRACQYLAASYSNGMDVAGIELFDLIHDNSIKNLYLAILHVIYSKAEAGDGRAMGRMGRAYRDGMGVQKDLQKSAEWLRKAAENGIPWANVELFDVLWNIGTPESCREMIEVIKPLAEAGDSRAIKRLNKAYKMGNV